MRAKLIAVYTVVVLVVGVLSYGLTKGVLGNSSSADQASRALAAAAAQVQLHGLVLERWLAVHARDPKLREPFDAGTPQARSDRATSTANAVRESAAADPKLSGVSPALVVLVDPQGVVLGRNGSGLLMRGDDLGAAYPPLKDALAKGVTGSDVWVNRDRNEQFLASYAPIAGESGQVIGGLVIGTSLNDERLTDASNRTSGQILILGVKKGDALDVVAKSAGATADHLAVLTASPAKEGVLSALTSAKAIDLGGLPPDLSASAGALDGYGDGQRAVLVSIASLDAPGAQKSLLWTMLGAMAVGIVLVVIGAYFLDAYVSRPVSEIEEGLLAIMNGRTDLRFEIEHAELGGLVFRLNSLLNHLLGVQEDNTDEQGHVSQPRAARHFEEAFAVDERMAATPGDVMADSRILRQEGAAKYYARIFEEYIAAKKSVGDPTDHITREAFIDRIKTSESEMARKHGKAVRYKVEVRDKEVVLLAVPLE